MDKFKPLIEYLDTLPMNDCAPGVDCKVMYHNSEIFRHTSGWLDAEEKIPMRNDARFFMYSATKPVTCATALTLYEKGKFLLNEPLYEYIPEFKDMYVKTEIDGKTEIVPAKNPIRIVDLFTMSAGYGYDIGCDAIKRVRTQTNGACPTLDVVKALATEPLYFEPGTHFSYSLCHDILAGLVEVVSGKKFGEYMKEAIFDPLGMNNTGFVLSDESLMASQYSPNRKEKVFSKIDKKCIFKLGTEYESGGAGLISTVDDMAKFTNCMAMNGYTKDGESILGKGTIELMRTNHLDDASLADFRQNGALHRVGYGYGLGVRTMIDRANGGVNGPIGEFGWPGAGGVYTMMDTQNGVSLVFATHTIGDMHILYKVHPRIRNIFYSCFDKFR